MPGKRLILDCRQTSAAIICVVLAVSAQFCLAGADYGQEAPTIWPTGSDTCLTTVKNPGGWSLSDPNSVRRGEATGNGLVGPSLRGKLLISILIVAILGVAAIYISKKFLPKITRGAGRKIRIVETVHLAPNKAVHLLRVGTRQLLVASSKERVDFLADVTGALLDVPLEEVEDDI